MKKAEIRKPLLKAVESILLPKGYKKRKSDDTFEYIFKTENGYRSVLPIMRRYGEDAEITMVFSIRIDVVSEIICHIENISEEYRDEAHTFVATISSLGISDRSDIVIRSEKDLEEAIVLIKSVLENQVMLFFEQNQTIADLDKHFNIENLPKDSLFDYPFVGLICAVLNKNPRVNFFENYYRNRIIKKNEHYKQEYENLVAYLKENYSESFNM